MGQIPGELVTLAVADVVPWKWTRGPNGRLGDRVRKGDPPIHLRECAGETSELGHPVPHKNKSQEMDGPDLADVGLGNLDPGDPRRRVR